MHLQVGGCYGRGSFTLVMTCVRLSTVYCLYSLSILPGAVMHAADSTV